MKYYKTLCGTILVIERNYGKEGKENYENEYYFIGTIFHSCSIQILYVSIDRFMTDK
jgi:hypothetical protein